MDLQCQHFWCQPNPASCCRDEAKWMDPDRFCVNPRCFNRNVPIESSPLLRILQTNISRRSVDCLPMAHRDEPPQEQISLRGRDCFFKPDGGKLRVAIRAIVANSSLRRLHLNFVNFSQDDLNSLVRAIQNNTSLQDLFVAYRKLPHLEFMIFLESLTGPPLHILQLYCTRIRPSGATLVAKVLQKNHLKELDLEFNQFGDEGAIAIAKVLRTNTSLEFLNLRLNHIGSDGAVALADALQGNAMLQDLKLGCNPIGDDGAIALARAMHSKRTNLTRLESEYNKILVSALEEDTSLRRLGFFGNDRLCGDDNFDLGEEILKVLAKNTTLQQLHLGPRLSARYQQGYGTALDRNRLLLDAKRTAASPTFSLVVGAMLVKLASAPPQVGSTALYWSLCQHVHTIKPRFR